MRARGSEDRRQEAERGMQGGWQVRVREDGRGERGRTLTDGTGSGRSALDLEIESLDTYGHQSKYFTKGLGARTDLDCQRRDLSLVLRQLVRFCTSFVLDL